MKKKFKLSIHEDNSAEEKSLEFSNILRFLKTFNGLEMTNFTEDNEEIFWVELKAERCEMEIEGIDRREFFEIDKLLKNSIQLNQ